jgi:hypothetical protein
VEVLVDAPVPGLYTGGDTHPDKPIEATKRIAATSSRRRLHAPQI